MTWIIVIIVLIGIGLILDREIYFYEGVHLGPRIQSWLYDRWSTKYDEGKHQSQLRDDEMLASPLLEKLDDIPKPFILDFATGTGRLSYTLLKRTDFSGRIIALDISQGMLEQAARKISRAPASAGQVDLIRYQSMPLPFPDSSFDGVCCLEVLELLPDTKAALKEMARLLRPGGILLTSRGTEESGRKAKVRSETDLTSILQDCGFENIQITKWWKLFDRVLANKTGTSKISGSKQITDVLNCSSCDAIDWIRENNIIRCNHCGNKILVTKEQIILM